MSYLRAHAGRTLLGAFRPTSRSGDKLICASSFATRKLAVSQETGCRLFSLESHAVASKDVKRLIREITAITTDHLTPELKLHLITPECALWTAEPSSCPLPDPYWAFYWPGGQALSRYVLDHPQLVAGQSVVDVGCGCGSSAIAAALAGASVVTANDIDPVALVATRLNADANGASLQYSRENFIEGGDGAAAPPMDGAAPSALASCDVVLLGDMLYSDGFADALFCWALSLARLGKRVYVGDPGRDYVRRLPPGNARTVASYRLPESCTQANSGFTDAAVLQLLPRSADGGESPGAL